MAIEDDLRAAIVTLADTSSAAIDEADLCSMEIGITTSYPPVVEAINSIRTQIATIRTAIEAARAVAAA